MAHTLGPEQVYRCTDVLSLSLVVHALCLARLYLCVGKVYTSLCTLILVFTITNDLADPTVSIGDRTLAFTNFAFYGLMLFID